MRIALKYCGACNPEVDLSRIGRSLVELINEQGWQMVDPGEVTESDVLVLLCGCPRTCIDKEELRRLTRRVIVVAGKRLGWRPVSEEELPRAIISAVQELSPE